MKNQPCRKTRLAAAVAVIAMMAPMWAVAQSAPMMPKHAAMAAGAASDGAPSSMDMRKSMDSMNEKMGAMKMSGNPDYDFATMMRVHHQGALDMAQTELDIGKDPVMRRAAEKIIASQKKEIAQFDQWLSQHKQTGAHSMAK